MLLKLIQSIVFCINTYYVNTTTQTYINASIGFCKENKIKCIEICLLLISFIRVVDHEILEKLIEMAH